jgi:hypothetical protein
VDFVAGFAAELTKLAADEKPSAFKKFVNSESGAMFAEHLPFGGALLGAARGQKAAPGAAGGRLRNAARGVVGSTIGNVAGATAGLGAGARISHALKAHGHKVPGWLMPTAIGAGGLAIAPAVVHRFTHS